MDDLSTLSRRFYNAHGYSRSDGASSSDVSQARFNATVVRMVGGPSGSLGGSHSRLRERAPRPAGGVNAGGVNAGGVNAGGVKQPPQAPPAQPQPAQPQQPQPQQPHSDHYSTELMIDGEQIRLLDFGYASSHGNFTCGGRVGRGLNAGFKPVHDGYIFVLLAAWLAAMEPTDRLKAKRATQLSLALHQSVSPSHTAALALETIRHMRRGDGDVDGLL